MFTIQKKYFQPQLVVLNFINMQHFVFKAWLLPVIFENNELLRQDADKLIVRDLSVNWWLNVSMERETLAEAFLKLF